MADYKKSFAPGRADEVQGRVLAVLSHRQGLMELAAGHFDEAAPLLQGGYADINLYPDQAFAWQSLGRFRDASASLQRMLKGKEDTVMSRYLVRRGYLAFAQGEFELANDSFAFALTIGSSRPNDGPVDLINYLSQLLAGRKVEIPAGAWEILRLSEREGSDMWPDAGILFLQGKLAEAEVFARMEKRDWAKEDDLCEAHFLFSVLDRVKKDPHGEMKHLQAALETKAFTNQCYSLATIRVRELSLVKK